MTTFEKIAAANATIKATDIRGKSYAMVNERIKAFRMAFPNGKIIPRMVSDEGGKCVFEACVYDEKGTLLGMGHAYEREEMSQINRTSYIENCETSAVGRALAMCGFGIDVSIASYEDMETALASQPVSPVTLKAFKAMLEEEGIREETILRLYKLKKLADITEVKHRHVHENIAKILKDQEAHDEGETSSDVPEH